MGNVAGGGAGGGEEASLHATRFLNNRVSIGARTWYLLLSSVPPVKVPVS